MKKRTISNHILLLILARLLILVNVIAAVIATGKMAAVPSLTKPDAPPAGNSPA